MHHLNCFVLEALAKSLHRHLREETLLDCFSNQADELAFIFPHFQLKCPFYRGEIFFQEEKNPVSKSRLFMPQFRELKQKKVLEVKAHLYERSFELVFEGHDRLIFKCHGRKSNILLYREGVFTDHFRKALENDKFIEADRFQDKIGFDPLQLLNPEFSVQAFSFLPESYIQKIKRASNPSLIPEIANLYHRITGFKTLADELEMEVDKTTDTVLEDLTAYTLETLRRRRFQDSKQELIALCKKQIADKRAFLAANAQALKQLEEQRNPEEIGHILMAGLQVISEGISEIKLPDIYHGNEISVKLNPKLSPVENAETYYKKAKGKPHTIRLLQAKISQAEKSLLALTQKLESLELAKAFKDIKKYPLEKAADKKQGHLPYKYFECDGFEILVGKNAESNEKILNYFSDKDDWWFHAKDVAGSHVLLRTKQKGKIPEKVMEYAAGLAAYYSKNRNQSLVTVTYTLRKYVRKFKGGSAGQVLVKNEASLLVKPLIPQA